MSTQRSELDSRVVILNNFMNVPHGNLSLIQEIHNNTIISDPDFYRHVASWYSENGIIRDQNIVFAASLITYANDPTLMTDMRDVGLALAYDMPPHLLTRVYKYIKVYDHKVKEFVGKTKSIKSIKIGLNRNPPNSFKSMVKQYLRERENENRIYDISIKYKNDIKTLYAGLKISHSDLAQMIYFENNPPEGSIPYVLKQLANTKDNSIKESLLEHNIPWRIAVSAMGDNITPVLELLLINKMSDKELMNNLSAIEKRCGKNKDIMGYVKTRVKSVKNIHSFRAEKSIDKIDDVELKQTLTDTVDKKISSNRGIDGENWVIMVDKSSSMDSAIEVAKRVTSILAPLCGGDLYIIFFDSGVNKFIKIPKNKNITFSEIKEMTKFVKANGGTSFGPPVLKLIDDNIIAHRLLYITDQEELRSPRLVDVLPAYIEKLGFKPNLYSLTLRVRGVNYLERVCKSLDVPYDNIDIDSKFGEDPYSQEQLIGLMTSKTIYDLVETIMNYRLPSWKKIQEAIYRR